MRRVALRSAVALQGGSSGIGGHEPRSNGQVGPLQRLAVEYDGDESVVRCDAREGILAQQQEIRALSDLHRADVAIEAQRLGVGERCRPEYLHRSESGREELVHFQPAIESGRVGIQRRARCVGAEQQTPPVLRQVPRRLFDSNTSGGHLLLEAGLRPGFGLRDDLRERLPGLLVKPLPLRGGIPADEAGGQNERESRIGEKLCIEQVGVA
jgi:hypothetical protein